MAHSMLLRVPLYHVCDSRCSRYRDTIVHECLTMFCATGAPPKNAITVGIDETESGVTGLSKDISRLAPLPEVLYNFGIVTLLRKAYEDRYGPRPDTPCIVHCRLDDVKDSPHKHFQKRIEDTRLLKLLQFCQSRYKRVYIETTLHDVSLMETLMGQLQFHVKVQGHRDIDESIWVMANANPLVMSRSNFSLLAGLLNPRVAYSYEAWFHFDEITGADTPCRGERTLHFQILKDFEGLQ